MQAFVAWFNDSAPTGTKSLTAITRAAIGHLWFESIHTFADGNGRIGRAIAEKALAQSLEAPPLTPLTAKISRTSKAYFGQLNTTKKQTHKYDGREWLAATNGTY